MGASASSPAQAVTIYGAQTGGYYPGVASFPSAGGTPTNVFEYNGFDSKYGSVFTGDAFYMTQMNKTSWSTTVYAMSVSHNPDLTEWGTTSRINEKLSVADVPTAMTWNSVTGAIYACFMTATDTEFSFGTFNESNGTASVIAPLSQQLVTLATDEIGAMYGVGADGKLYSVSLTGELTEIGSTGVNPSAKYASGSAFDTADGTLYWAVNTKGYDSNLYTIDLTTGAATLVYTFPDNTYLTSLYIPEGAPSEEAPAAVTDFLAAPQGFENQLDITFTLPSKTVAGEDMLGAVKYKVLVDGVILADTQGGPGQAISLSTQPGVGKHNITLLISNTSGKGARCTASVYVGEDNPAAVTFLDIATDGNTVTLTWGAPVAGLNGGNFNSAALVYDVVRLNDGTTVAEGITDTEYSETLEPEGLTNYSYSVTPRCGTLSGPATESRSVLIGAGMTPPYTQNFDNDDTFDAIYFSAYDANNDGKGWSFYSNPYSGKGNARYTYSSSEAADDWLFTCPLNLNQGLEYELNFTLNCSRWGNGETLEVMMGTAPDVASMTETVIASTDYEGGFNDIVTGTIAPQTTATYYLGFHITSGADSYNVDLDNIEIKAGTIADGVDTVSLAGMRIRAVRGGIVVTADSDTLITIVSIEGTSREVKVAAGTTLLPLARGIHAVKSGSAVAKAMVR